MSKRTRFGPRSSEGSSWSDLDPIDNPPTSYSPARASSAGPSRTVDSGRSRSETSNLSAGYHQPAASGPANFTTESGEAVPDSLDRLLAHANKDHHYEHINRKVRRASDVLFYKPPGPAPQISEASSEHQSDNPDAEPTVPLSVAVDTLKALLKLYWHMCFKTILILIAAFSSTVWVLKYSAGADVYIFGQVVKHWGQFFAHAWASLRFVKAVVQLNAANAIRRYTKFLPEAWQPLKESYYSEDEGSENSGDDDASPSWHSD